MNVSDARHPVWPIMRVAVYMLALWGVLWFTATTFDATEMRSIVVMFLVASAGEAGIRAFTKGQ